MGFQNTNIRIQESLEDALENVKHILGSAVLIGLAGYILLREKLEQVLALPDYAVLNNRPVTEKSLSSMLAQKPAAIPAERIRRHIAQNYPDLAERIGYFNYGKRFDVHLQSNGREKAFEYVDEIFFCLAYFRDLGAGEGHTAYLDSYAADLNMFMERGDDSFFHDSSLKSLRNAALAVFYYNYDRLKGRLSQHNVLERNEKILEHAWKLQYHRKVWYSGGKPVYSEGHSPEVLSLMHQYLSLSCSLNAEGIEQLHMGIITSCSNNEEAAYLKKHIRMMEWLEAQSEQAFSTYAVLDSFLESL